MTGGELDVVTEVIDALLEVCGGATVLSIHTSDMSDAQRVDMYVGPVVRVRPTSWLAIDLKPVFGGSLGNGQIATSGGATVGIGGRF